MIILKVHWTRAAAVVVLSVVVAWPSAAQAASQRASAAQAPANCDAAKAVLRRGKIRVFLRGEKVRTYYLCSDRLRTPRAYHSRKVDPAEDEPFDFSVRGRRLLYTDFHVITQIELLAWVDLRTAGYREIRIPAGHEYDEIRALGPDGAIAFVTTDADKGQRIWYAAARARALATPRIVARATDGDIVPESLRISGGRVHWKTPYGPPRSAALSGPARTVPAASRTCDSQERVYRKGAVRIFMRTVGNIERFYLCSSRLRKPKLVSREEPVVAPADLRLSPVRAAPDVLDRLGRRIGLLRRRLGRPAQRAPAGRRGGREPRGRRGGRRRRRRHRGARRQGAVLRPARPPQPARPEGARDDHERRAGERVAGHQGRPRHVADDGRRGGQRAGPAAP